MNTESEQAWARHEQAELKRQAEWLRNERAKGHKAGGVQSDLPKPAEKQPLLGRLKKLFGSKE